MSVKSNPNNWDYSQFKKIDGSHPYRSVVPDGYIDYSARTRHGGKVFYFNFDLARDMGLISADHPDILYESLKNIILDTFSIQIINEYDIKHNVQYPKEDIKPNQYMATRYLQLQHPGKKGFTSGDGRSLWNGYFKNGKGTWDVSSCGTGATCLSPATAIENKFYKTGDKKASYGSGRSDLWDGVCAALMSDILHKNGIKTERTLTIIGYPDNTSVNVRAYKNLIRPAHIFCHVKQNNYKNLKNVVDYYIDRQVKNKNWKKIKNNKEKYLYFLNRITEDFASTAALFEREYIFCWLDWDGDNILMDSAIIDYGSLRQFGLYHNEYRYDDVDRMSTTISEQKKKAKYLVQTFIQITDYLISGEKTNIKNFSKHEVLDDFDRIYKETKLELLLYKIGFTEQAGELIMASRTARDELELFSKNYEFFEKVKSKAGKYEVEDGVCWDAVFCIRDIMRELPIYLLKHGNNLMPPDLFVETLKSNYALAEDVKLIPSRISKIREFQISYLTLVTYVARRTRKSNQAIYRNIIKRSNLINRYDRVTGDSIIHLADKILKTYQKINSQQMHTLINEFINSQILKPEAIKKGQSRKKILNKYQQDVISSMQEIILDNREGI